MNIPKSELNFTASRSGGAGGQNVNKVETKITLRWNFQKSPLLTDEQKNLVGGKLKNRINDKNELIIHSQAERSQSQNKELAIKILNRLVNSALTIPKKRRRTKVPKSAKERRLSDKKIQAKKKSYRKKIEY